MKRPHYKTERKVIKQSGAAMDALTKMEIGKE
jgi:hypothetical protein